MPYRSKKQRAFMHAKHPRIAKEMASKTKSMKRLPARAKKKASRKGR